MSWLKLDDGFLRHPKFVDAMGRHVHALYTWLGLLSWAKQNLTDGIVPAAAVRITDGPPHGKQRALAIQALVDAKLVRREPNGDLRLHDFLDWNDPSELVKNRRREDRNRKRSSGRPVSDSALTPRVTQTLEAVDSCESPTSSRSYAPIPDGFQPSETETETIRRKDTSSSLRSPDPLPSLDDSGEAGASKANSSGRAQTRKPKVKPESDPNVLAVFEHWRATLHPRAMLDAPRAKAVRRQLDAGRTVVDLCSAVDGCAASSWHVENGQTDLELICRDAKHVEMFIGRANGKTSGKPDLGSEKAWLS